MANHRGTEGVVKIGSDSLGELREWELQEEATTIDDTTLADAWDTHALGRKRWNGSATAFWDEGDTAQTALANGASVTLNMYPEGATTGDTYFTGTASVTRIRRRANRDSMVEVEFEFVGSGALTSTTAA